MYEIRETREANQDMVVVSNENDGFSATIAPGFGGACVSLRRGEHELLHGALVFGEGAMKGRIPVLFPVVGRSFVGGELGAYRHQGTVYPMGIHGFVKDMAWEVTGTQCDECSAGVTCEVRSDSSTLASYTASARGTCARHRIASIPPTEPAGDPEPSKAIEPFRPRLLLTVSVGAPEEELDDVDVGSRTHGEPRGYVVTCRAAAGARG